MCVCVSDHVPVVVASLKISAGSVPIIDITNHQDGYNNGSGVIDVWNFRDRIRVPMDSAFYSISYRSARTGVPTAGVKSVR